MPPECEYTYVLINNLAFKVLATGFFAGGLVAVAGFLANESLLNTLKSSPGFAGVAVEV